jgi:N-acetylglucosaminyl-diphospho-decaprenol L-rhamnosyltransferase
MKDSCWVSPRQEITDCRFEFGHAPRVPVETITVPLASIVIVTYNDGVWLTRCLESLQAQTLFGHIEVIVVDNASADGTAGTAQKLLEGWPNGRFLQGGGNIGFGPGNNRGADLARGKYLYFINSDTWFEPDCVEQLYLAAERASAAAAGATMLEYGDDTLIARGSDGMDCLGNPVSPHGHQFPKPLFCIAGFLFIRKDVFDRIGHFDERYFMYGEELDMCWRLWLSGETIVPAFDAQVHHRGAVGVNPDGGAKPTENRTSELKRFYANRNHLLSIAKNSRNLLLVMLIPAAMLICLEGLVSLMMTRRGATFKKGCLAPFLDFCRLWPHIREERRRLSAIRKHSDFWMLRFLRFRFGRSHEVKQIVQKGFPKFGR